jgi:hypothetical protein
MAKGAASEESLGKLHDKLATVLARVIDGYIKRLDVIENVTPEQLEDEMLAELFNDNAMPNPAMLTVVSNFLKNNEIRFSTEEVSKLGELNEQLAIRRKARGSIASLSLVPAVGE